MMPTASPGSGHFCYILDFLTYTVYKIDYHQASCMAVTQNLKRREFDGR